MTLRDYRNVFWDWNGTLLDDTDACVAALNRLLRRRGRPTLSRLQYRERFGFPVKTFYATLGFDFEREDWDALTGEFHEAFRAHEPDEVRPGVRRLLDRIRAAGPRMSVLSALEQELLRRAIETFGLARYFDAVKGCSDLYSHSKVEVGRELLRETGVRPEETVMIGDTDHDHEVAEALGLDCILVADGHQTRPRLERCGRRVVDGLRELEGLL